MIIGVSQGRNPKWLKILENGLQNTGHKFTYITKNNIKDIKLCDAVCIVSYNLDVGIRQRVFDTAKKFNKPVIFIEKGFLGSIKKFTFAIDKPKITGMDYANVLAGDSSRWESVRAAEGILLKEWNDNPKDKCTILLHNLSGYMSNTVHVKEQAVQVEKTIRALQNECKKVVIKVHPKMKSTSIRYGSAILSKSKSMDVILENTDCCLGWHTNALCDAVMRGVPIICLHEDCMAYELGTHKVNEALIRPDRQKWLNKMAWVQWTKVEMSQGLNWPVIQYAIENYDIN